MRQLINWKDHVVEHPNRYKEVDNGDGTFDLQKQPGEIIQQGTPMNATNFNGMDWGIFEALFISNENLRMLRLIGNSVESLVGEKIQVILTNTQLYPFNNSVKTIKLPKTMNTNDYTIEFEVENVEGGAVGELVVSDKLLNGFKVAFTGSAKKIVINYYIRGGV